VDEQVEPLAVAGELDDRHLADPPRPPDPHPDERGERRVDALHRHHSGRERRFDLGTGQRGAKAADGDLDLGKLGHGLIRDYGPEPWPSLNLSQFIRLV
jgi:hypothetical protein